jgi:hypothetical protein
MISKKITAFKFCLVCIIILGNNGNVLVLKIKLLIIRFIVLLTSCLTPRMLNISVLIKPINLANMEMFGLLYYIFYIKLMVLLRIFGALYYLNLSFCQITYSN